MFKKLLFTLFVATLLFSCKEKPEKYNLKWNIPNNKVVIYSIQMKTIDSLSAVSEQSTKVLIEAVSKIYGDSIKVNVSSASLYKGLMQQLSMLSYFALIRSDDSKNLKVDFITKQTKQYEPIKYIEIFNKFIKKVSFKGVLKSNGTLLTDIGEEVCDPKINILFQLPQNPVAIGESWSLNIIPEWQKNQIDSSTINKVTLTNIDVENGDSIATLQYDLQNTEPTGKTMGFNGNAKFNISKGTWINYSGTLSQKNTGMMAMKQVQSIKLSEISIAKYKSLLKQAQKTSVLNSGEVFLKQSENQEGNQKTENESVTEPKTTEITDNCPEVFRVQLLASKNQITDIKSKFSNISHKVDEVILDNNAYKYKYTVGKKCDRKQAEILLKEIKQFYPNAYIIKTDSK